MKYTTGWEYNREKHPYYGKSIQTDVEAFDGFCYIFSGCGNLMRKPMHFPYDEVYHRI